MEYMEYMGYMGYAECKGVVKGVYPGQGGIYMGYLPTRGVYWVYGVKRGYRGIWGIGGNRGYRGLKNR